MGNVVQIHIDSNLENNYGQPIMCLYCQSLDNSSMQHNTFLKCSSFVERKEKQLKIIATKLKSVKTPPHITSGILTDVKKDYNNNELKQQQHLPTSIKNQTTIGWEHFCRGRISKS